MVNIALLSLLAAQAAGWGPPDRARRPRLRTPSRRPSPSPSRPVATTSGTPGGIPIGKLVLMPEIAVVVDGALGYTTLSTEQQEPTAGPLPRHKAWPLLQEVELAFQATVDPYIRGDVFITFTPEGVEVEEAYLKTLSLPWGLQVKAGQNLLAVRSDQPAAPPPVDLRRSAPLDAAAGRRRGALRGRAVTSPGSRRFPGSPSCTSPTRPPAPASTRVQQQLTGVARLIQYFDLSDSATLGVGLSWALFQAEAPEQWKNLAGADLYVKFRDPTSRSSVVLQGEIYGRQLGEQAFSEARWGGYGQAVWRIDRNWEVGARYDNAPAPGGLRGRDAGHLDGARDLLHERVLPAPAAAIPGAASGGARPASRGSSASSSPSAPTRRTRSRRRP